jgi:hypothetical protein
MDVNYSPWHLSNVQGDIYNMIYDITSKENALETLQNLTGFKKEYWEHYSYECQVMRKDIDKALNDVLTRFNLDTNFNLNDIKFTCLHITTSNNGCNDIIKFGLMDLKNTYSKQDTELRRFLDMNNIYIDLVNETIEVAGKKESIHYESTLSFNMNDRERILWSIGRKFYYDFCVCGFLSIDSESPYGGYVHLRPEIIMNISKICNMDLERIWKDKHKCYIVKFRVSYIQLVNVFSEDDSIERIRESLLFKAFLNTIYESEEVILLKNNVSVSSEEIINVYEYNFH